MGRITVNSGCEGGCDMGDSFYYTIPLLAIMSLWSVAGGETWEIETVAEETSFTFLTDRSFRLDSDGYPRFVYGRTYAWFDGASWHTERFETTSDLISYPSLAIDEHNRPHIAYQHRESEDLWYARRTTLGWHTEAVDCSGDVGFHTSIAIDNLGRPCISYRDLTDGSLNYACKYDDGWHIEIPDGSDSHWSGYYTSLALDSGGYPHIAYFRAWQSSYAFKDSTGWHLEAVDSTESLGGYGSLSLDPFEQPRISYSLGFSGIKHAVRTDGVWQIETINQNGVPVDGFENAIGVDSLGRSHISFSGDSGAEYVYQDGDGWLRDVIEPNQGFFHYGYYPSIAIDASNRPHIGYVGQPRLGEDRGAGSLKYVQYVGQGWSIETVAEEGCVKECSIALDSFNVPHLFYTFRHVLVRTDVIHAYPCEGEWVYEILGQTTDPYPIDAHNDISIAIDAQDGIHFCWEENDTLRYAYDTGTGWSTETVPCTGWWNCELDTDTDCRPHIGYVYHWGADTHDLYHAYRASTGWEFSRVDTNVYHGSLTLDNSGEPHLVYNSYPPLSMVCDMYYSFRHEGEWSHEFVDNGTALGFGNISPEVDDLGRIHVTYGDGTSIVYGFKGESGWEFMRVGGANGIGAENSLELDHGGRPHIAYEGPSYGNAHLIYAHFDGSQWCTETVDNACEFTALALDESDHAHVVYVRAGDLLYAWRPEVSAQPDMVEYPAISGLRIEDVSPNPVHAGAIIRWSVDQVNPLNSKPLTLKVYDCAGRLVGRQIQSVGDTDSNQLWWKPVDVYGNELSAGYYFIRIEATDRSVSNARCVIVR